MELETVKHSFELWRKHRTKKEAIPEALWSQVRLLDQKYKKSEITKALGINSAQLDRGRERRSPGASDFAVVHCSLPPKDAKEEGVLTDNVSSCEISLSIEAKRLQIYMDVKALASVLPLLEQYL